MAVITNAAKRKPGDIAVSTVSNGIILYQDAGLYCTTSMTCITSRQDADDLIIALMLARDTLWPIENGANNG
jgi:hypothetical protein